MAAKFLVLCGSISVALSAKENGIFMKAATRYVNDKPRLIDLYVEHYKAHAEHKVSELDSILEDMVLYVQENENEHAPRHILTVLADDMGYADIGFNDPTFVTPLLDTLAGHGVKFNNFYVQV